MWLIKASLRNPYMVATLVFMILVLGIVSAVNIPVDILPVFKTPAVQVMTYYQGMPSSSVEKTITNRIERWANQAPGRRIGRVQVGAGRQRCADLFPRRHRSQRRPRP